MSGVKPDIWTRSQFKTETNPKDVRKALAGIDALLDQWDNIKDGRSAEQRVKHLQSLIATCGHYIREKEAKKAKKDQARFGKASSRLVNRITKVKQLSQQTFLRLAWEQYHYQRNVRSGMAGTLRNAHGNSAGLKPGYTHERGNFDAIKQQQNLRGTNTPINPQGGGFVHQQMEAADPTAQPAHIQLLLGKGFGNLTLGEFNTLQAHFSQGTGGLGSAPFVHYARKDERFRELMLIPIDGLLYKADGTLCDIPWAGFAVDLYGNLLAAKSNKTWTTASGKDAQFNHSTLAAGRDVVCAGLLKIQKGRITYISNESGHYKPTAEMLSNCIYVLIEEYHLPLADSVDKVVDVSGGGDPEEYNNILSFIATHPSTV